MTDHLMPTYARIDLAFERGEGPYLYSTDGRRFLDFAGGIAVNALGHSHPRLVAALNEQAGKLWHVSNLYRIPEAEHLAARLAEASFAERVFFCNSGAEAIECGIKLVRKVQKQRGYPERNRIIACDGAFHGRTITTLSAAGNAKYLNDFTPGTGGFDHVAFGNLNELRAAITEETAGILVEPVQGEGGIRPASPDYQKGLRNVCDEFGLLLFFDEVQCGIGRSGKLFAHQWTDVAPDVLATAKGLGGGFPVGACLASEEAGSTMGPGTHGSTFGGNPLAMAVGNAVLDVILAPGFLDGVTRVSKILWGGLQEVVERHPAVLTELRGSGLMLGLRCQVPNTEVIARLRDGGLLTVGAAENVVRLLPPLIIDETHVAEAVEIIEQVCAGWAEAA